MQKLSIFEICSVFSKILGDFYKFKGGFFDFDLSFFEILSIFENFGQKWPKMASVFRNLAQYFRENVQ